MTCFLDFFLIKYHPDSPTINLIGSFIFWVKNRKKKSFLFESNCNVISLKTRKSQRVVFQ